MKTQILRLSMLIPVLFLSACCSIPAERGNMQTDKPVESIPTNSVWVGYRTEPVHIFVQNERILDEESMDKGLKGLGPGFSERVDKAVSAETWSRYAYYGQLGTLAACLVSPVPAVSLGFCLTSIGLGVGVAIPQYMKGNELRREMVVEYNSLKK